MARKALAYLGPTIPKIRIFRNLRVDRRLRYRRTRALQGPVLAHDSPTLRLTAVRCRTDTAGGLLLISIRGASGDCRRRVAALSCSPDLVCALRIELVPGRELCVAIGSLTAKPIRCAWRTPRDSITTTLPRGHLDGGRSTRRVVPFSGYDTHSKNIGSLM
jgi:hypothetical protein